MIERDICAVILTYQPDAKVLARQLESIVPQVGSVVIVDNGSVSAAREAMLETVRLFPSVRTILLGENVGVAAGHNRGIRAAREDRCRYVLFLDQDSIPDESMVRHLAGGLRRLENEGRKVACVGPRVRFPDCAELSSFASPAWLGLRREKCLSAGSLIECDTIISSGSLIPVQVVEAIGGMEEGLFIDQVDIEWCLRARSKGYRVFGVCGAILEHRLGEALPRIWIGRWRRLPRHKPFRYYYIFRNTVLVSRRPYVSWKWVLFNLRCLAALFLAYGLFTRSRMGELGMMLKGAVHGVRGVRGKLESQ
jgi:rhamnosyltransferase